MAVFAVSGTLLRAVDTRQLKHTARSGTQYGLFQYSI